MKGVFRSQYGAGYFGAHRADLHAVLQQALPADCVRLNARCTGVTQTGRRRDARPSPTARTARPTS